MSKNDTLQEEPKGWESCPRCGNEVSVSPGWNYCGRCGHDFAAVESASGVGADPEPGWGKRKCRFCDSGSRRGAGVVCGKCRKKMDGKLKSWDCRVSGHVGVITGQDYDEDTYKLNETWRCEACGLCTITTIGSITVDVRNERVVIPE